MSHLYAYSFPITGADQAMMEEFPHPHEVSTEVLGSMQFTSLLDAGCGEDTRLAEYVSNDRGGVYVGVDNGRKRKDNDRVVPITDVMRLKVTEKGLNARVLEGDMRSLPETVEPVDVSHVRFVLMHLSPEGRHETISELKRVTRKAIVLLEYDWGTVKSSSGSKWFKRFVKASQKMMEKFRVNPKMGAELCEVAGNAIYERFPRPEGDYTGEVVKLCKKQYDLALQANMQDMAQEFAQIAEAFLAASRAGEPITLVPADICAAVIRLE